MPVFSSTTQTVHSLSTYSGVLITETDGGKILCATDSLIAGPNLGTYAAEIIELESLCLDLRIAEATRSVQKELKNRSVT